MTRVVRVALAGCGTVGGALLDLLARHGAELERRAGLRVVVTRVLVRDPLLPRSTAVDRALLTAELGEFLAAPADVVVEAIGGTMHADVIARHALVRGRRLVTANKALLRAAGPSLAALASQHRAAGAALDFEAAIGGGVPIVRSLREALAGHGITAIRGVLNGTTNYVLSRAERGVSFADAVRAAQRAGFAEADPTRDLDGTDAADKIAVLAWLAFGVDPAALEVRCRGITPACAAAARDAARAGRVLRLVATAVKVGGGVHANVVSKVLHRDDPLARAVDQQNVIEVVSDSSGTIAFSGPGAGGSATAASLLADLLHAAAPLPAPALACA